jgi:dynein heavy chain
VCKKQLKIFLDI